MKDFLKIIIILLLDFIRDGKIIKLKKAEKNQQILGMSLIIREEKIKNQTA